MTHILHLTCSPRECGSYSTALSHAVVQRLLTSHPGATSTLRDLHAEPFAPIDAAYANAVVSRRRPDDLRSASLNRSAAAIADLRAADRVVIGTPMHNFTIPAALKLWVDLVVRAFQTFEPTAGGKIGLLPDRPVVVAIASGGTFEGPGANQPDFLTPYLTAALGCMGLRDLRFLPLQGTARRSREDIGRAMQDLIDQIAP